MKLVLILGPMKSGKSFEMINLFAPLKYAKMPFCLYQSAKNYRDNAIQSRNNASINAIKIESLRDIKTSGVKIIGIDEIHMFDEKDVYVLEKILKNGIDLIVSGLDTDYRGKVFPIIKKILELSPSKIICKKSVCENCRDIDAGYTQVLKNGKPILDKLPSIIPEDGTYFYKPVCRNCFIKK